MDVSRGQMASDVLNVLKDIDFCWLSSLKHDESLLSPALDREWKFLKVLCEKDLANGTVNRLTFFIIVSR